MNLLLFVSITAGAIILGLGGIFLRAFTRQRRVVCYNRLGEQCQGWEMWDHAIAWYQKAIDLDPSSGVSHYNLGHVLYFAKNLPDAARAEFESAIACDDRMASAKYALGHLLFHTSGAIEEATGLLQQALVISPRLAEAYNTLGLIDIRREDWRGALEKFTTAVSLNERYDAALCNASIASIYQGKNADAVRLAERCVELQPRSSAALKNLGNIYGATGRREQAIDALRRSLALGPADWIVHFWIGCLHLQSNRPDRAVVSFHEALRLRGQFALAHYNLALSYEKLGDRSLAAKHIESAIELDPALGRDLIKEAPRGGH